MSDTSLAKIIQYGTSAARIAFTPDPAAGSQVLYLWYETDNPPDTFAWDGSAWVQIGGGGGGGSITSGTYASLPGSPSTGDCYLFTDSVYTIAQYNGATWDYFLDGKIAVPPGPKSGWTNLNPGSDLTVTDGAGTIDLSIAQNGSLNLRGIVKIATPATITYVFRSQMVYNPTQTFGVEFYDGTKLIGLELLTTTGTQTLRVQRWTNTTSASTTVFTQALLGFPATWGGLIYMKLTNGGGNLAFLWSLDGITFHQAYTEAVGTWLTPTGYGVAGVNLSAGDPLTVSLQSVVTT